MHLGKMAMELFPQTGTLQPSTMNAGNILYVVGWMMATIMWGAALVWLFFAAASIVSVSRHTSVPFNMVWWGFTFPLGVFASSTTQMGNELPSTFFKVLGTACTSSPTILSLVVADANSR
jgi:tellurite resistance protein TehA-like permease